MERDGFNGEGSLWTNAECRLLTAKWLRGQYNVKSYLRGLVACPYFMPEERFDSTWPFPQRLPLGAGWSGRCTAPGHNGVRPSSEELTSGCNLGYAKTCSRLPAERHADAVRFAIGDERDGLLRVLFVCERAYLPASSGELLYDKAQRCWVKSHDETAVQRMAECYVQAQMERRNSKLET